MHTVYEVIGKNNASINKEERKFRMVTCGVEYKRNQDRILESFFMREKGRQLFHDLIQSSMTGSSIPSPFYSKNK